ncbi:MAG TPA: glycosyltransferase family 39 protein [Thermoanaerobaculia bacterium]|jgi:4-amino-4-deoxy-L-arabinose transferase-like glycosyltransferase|nr:glycosyltransferase family 39 protein [Thermoanaerobaculia bacterium]
MPRQHITQESRSAPPRARPDSLFLIVALLGLLRLALLAPGLIPADLNLTYPFVGGDSHDWIANGLRLAGEDVRYSGRPPLLPLVIALLYRLSALSWLPLLLQGLFLATVLVFHRRAALLFPRRAAGVAALALLVNYSLGDFSLQVMADVPASCLLFLAAVCFLRAGEVEGERSRRWDLASGLLAGLAALTQSAGALWAPVAAATALVHRRRDRRSPWLWLAAMAPLAFPALWMALQPAALAGPGGHAADQWHFVALHAGSVPFYLLALASLLGVPGALLLTAGAGWLAAGGRRAVREPALFLCLGLAAALILFFVFLYGFEAKRFLVYGVWAAGLLLAAALARLRRRTVFWAVAGLLLAVSALPLPTAADDARAAGLWPAPPVVLAIPGAGLDPRAARPVREPWASWLRLSAPFRAWEARSRESAFVRPDPAALAADRSALFLYGDEMDGGGRFRTITRLSCALHKRVKFVSAATFDPYWRWIGVSPLGPCADYALYRARLPGGAETWLLAVPLDSPLRSRLDALPALPGWTPDEGPRLARGRETAAAIQRFVAGNDGFVALVPVRRPLPAQLYLPFLLETTELYVAEPGRGGATLRALAAAPRFAEQRFGPALVRRTEYLGRRTALISFRPVDGPLRGTAAPPPPPPPGPPRPRRSPPAPGAAGRPGG